MNVKQYLYNRKEMEYFFIDAYIGQTRMVQNL